MATVGNPGTAQGELRGFRRLWRTLKQIFHEVIGATFAVLALAWFNSALRAWTRDVAHWLIAVSVGVGFMFILFSLTSFRKSRQL